MSASTVTNPPPRYSLQSFGDDMTGATSEETSSSAVTLANDMRLVVIPGREVKGGTHVKRVIPKVV
jgi:hypothetical protein